MIEAADIFENTATRFWGEELDEIVVSSSKSRAL